MVPGVDSCLTQLHKTLRKAEVDTLVQVLASKDKSRVDEHFVGLIKEYNAVGGSSEVTVLTGFHAALADLFEGDGPGVCKYLQAYRKRYKGCGLPKEIDIPLVIKGMKGGVNMQPLRDEIKSLSAALKTVTTRPMRL